MFLLLMSKSFPCQLGMPSLICYPDSFNFPCTATIYRGPESPAHGRRFPCARGGELCRCPSGEDVVIQNGAVSQLFRWTPVICQRWKTPKLQSLPETLEWKKTKLLHGSSPHGELLCVCVETYWHWSGPASMVVKVLEAFVFVP